MKNRSEKIRLVLVISNLEFGGAQRQIVELANHLDSDRFDILILSLSEFVPLKAALTRAHVKVEIVKKRTKYDITTISRIAKRLREFDADIVHAFLYDSIIACRVAATISGTPLMLGSERNCNYSLKAIQLFAYRITKSFQHFCVANSDSGARFNADTLGYPMSHYRVVDNGVDTDRFQPGKNADLRKSLEIDDETIVVGIFASIKHQKNYEAFVRAANELTKSFLDIKFLVVGDQLYKGMHGSDEYTKKIHTLIEQLGLRKRFVFVGNREDVERYYQICDVTTLPSRFEGMPNSILESLASGIPVVASNVSDNERILGTAGCGFLVDPDDYFALAGRISVILSDGKLAAQLSAAAREHALSSFSVSVMASRAGQVYEELLEARRKSSATL